MKTFNQAIILSLSVALFSCVEGENPQPNYLTADEYAVGLVAGGTINYLTIDETNSGTYGLTFSSSPFTCGGDFDKDGMMMVVHSAAKEELSMGSYSWGQLPSPDYESFSISEIVLMVDGQRKSFNVHSDPDVSAEIKVREVEGVLSFLFTVHADGNHYSGSYTGYLKNIVYEALKQ